MERVRQRRRRAAPVAEAAGGVEGLLVSLRAGRAQALRPVLVTPATLQAVYQGASPLLWEAWRQCLGGVLLELSPDPARWGTLQVPASVLGLTLALQLPGAGACGAGRERNGTGCAGAGLHHGTGDQSATSP